MSDIKDHRAIMQMESMAGKAGEHHAWHYRKIFEEFGEIKEMEPIGGPGGCSYRWGAECTFVDGRTGFMAHNFSRPLIQEKK